MANVNIKRTVMDVLMLDGTEYQGVVVTLRDQIAAEEVSGRHNWGGTDKAPVRMGAFSVYSAMRRTGHFSGTYDDFQNAVETVSPVEVVDVDPTQTSTPSD